MIHPSKQSTEQVLTMNLHTENAQITADKMIERAKELAWTTMGIEVREGGQYVSANLRCSAKVSAAGDGTAIRITWHIDTKRITKAIAVALLAEHYEVTCEVPAKPANPLRVATYTVKQVKADTFKSGKGFAVIDQDDNCPAVFANQADAYNWIDTETKAATAHAAMQLKDPATAFRRIEYGNCGEFFGYAGNQFRARFDYEDDAIEWRAADPLNKGSIGELIDREELRKASQPAETFQLADDQGDIFEATREAGSTEWLVSSPTGDRRFDGTKSEVTAFMTTLMRKHTY